MKSRTAIKLKRFNNVIITGRTVINEKSEEKKIEGEQGKGQEKEFVVALLAIAERDTVFFCCCCCWLWYLTPRFDECIEFKLF